MVFDLTADFGYTADAETVTFNNVTGKQHVINKGVKLYEAIKKVSACLLLSLLVVTNMFSTTNSDKAYAEDHSYDGKVLIIIAVINQQ